MGDLVFYDDKKSEVVVSSGDIAKSFNKAIWNVNRDIENLLKKDVSKIEEMFFEDSYEDSYGRKQKQYLMNRDGFSLLAMGFTGEKALEWKLKYIEAFNKLEEEHEEKKSKDLVAESLMDPDFAIGILNGYKEEKARRMLAEAQIERDKPKVLFADTVSASSQSCLIGELAKLITQEQRRRGDKFFRIGQNNLFKWMRDNNYLCKSGERRNQPRQEYVEQGLFELKKSTFVDGNGVSVTRTTPKVTGKGQIYFINKFLA